MLALRDVGDTPDVTLDRAGIVEFAGGLSQYPNNSSVRLTVTAFDAERQLVSYRFIPGLEYPFFIFRIQGAGPTLTQCLRHRKAGDLTVSIINEDTIAVRVREKYSHRRNLRQHPDMGSAVQETVMAFPRRLLGADQFLHQRQEPPTQNQGAGDQQTEQDDQDELELIVDRLKKLGAIDLHDHSQI